MLAFCYFSMISFPFLIAMLVILWNKYAQTNLKLVRLLREAELTRKESIQHQMQIYPMTVPTNLEEVEMDFGIQTFESQVNLRQLSVTREALRSANNSRVIYYVFLDTIIECLNKSNAEVYKIIQQFSGAVGEEAIN